MKNALASARLMKNRILHHHSRSNSVILPSSHGRRLGEREGQPFCYRPISTPSRLNRSIARGFLHERSGDPPPLRSYVAGFFSSEAAPTDQARRFDRQFARERILPASVFRPHPGTRHFVPGPVAPAP